MSDQLSDKEYVDGLIQLIENSRDEAALDHNRRLAAGELLKIKDPQEKKRLEKKIWDSGGSLN
jgi:hypothetical protein